MYFRQGPADFQVVVGTNYLYSKGTHYTLNTVIYHNLYNTQDYTHDVAVLKTSTPFVFSARVQPIALANEQMIPDSACTLTGWGYTRNKFQKTPNRLQKIILKTIDLARCQKMLGTLPVVDSQVCTFNRIGQGACNGDSGGPLVFNGYQIGIVSWGIPCAKGKPDVFTNVYAFKDWIYMNAELEPEM